MVISRRLLLPGEVTEDAKLVIANQPTRGLDIGATEFVRQTLMDVRNSNRSVLLISADLEEILALSDRIAVMFGGRIVGVLNRDEADVQKNRPVNGRCDKGGNAVMTDKKSKALQAVIIAR